MGIPVIFCKVYYQFFAFTDVQFHIINDGPIVNSIHKFLENAIDIRCNTFGDSTIVDVFPSVISVCEKVVYHNEKSIGPRTVPCGTPPFKVCQFDTQLAILTRCLRSKRKLLIQFVIVDGTFISYNLCSRMLWSIRSKAFEKSSKKPLQRFLVYQFHITGDGRSLIGHELSKSFLKNQIVVCQSFLLYTQVANQ